MGRTLKLEVSKQEKLTHTHTETHQLRWLDECGFVPTSARKQNISESHASSNGTMAINIFNQPTCGRVRCFRIGKRRRVMNQGKHYATHQHRISTKRAPSKASGNAAVSATGEMDVERVHTSTPPPEPPNPAPSTCTRSVSTKVCNQRT